MLNANDFQQVSLKSKIGHLKKNGTYIAERYYMSYKVLLYAYNNFYVEVWQNLGYEGIYSIDIAPKRSIKEAYIDIIDLKKLGLDM